jgi:hypothetical protein
MSGRGPWRIRLYDHESGVLDLSRVYNNLLIWAWDGLDHLEDAEAKPVADAAANAEIASFGAFTVFGLDGYIEFPDVESIAAFRLKWG